MSGALAMRIEKPDDTLLIDIQEDAEKQGLILITDGRELKYTLAHFPLPDGWTRFIMRVKPQLSDPKMPRA